MLVPLYAVVTGLVTITLCLSRVEAFEWCQYDVNGYDGFPCKNTDECLRQSYRCDGQFDCRDKSDESRDYAGCTSYANGYFECYQCEDCEHRDQYIDGNTQPCKYGCKKVQTELSAPNENNVLKRKVYRTCALEDEQQQICLSNQQAKSITCICKSDLCNIGHRNTWSLLVLFNVIVMHIFT